MSFFSFVFRGLKEYFLIEVLVLVVFIFYFFVFPEYWFLCSFFTFVIGGGVYLFTGNNKK